MKSLKEIRAEIREADRQNYLKEMRSNAMAFREFTHPNAGGSLEYRGKFAASNLARAISYRDMARNLGKWKKEEV